MSLRDRPPRPFAARVAPSYPRALLAAGALIASSCAIYPLNDAPSEPDPGGVVAYPYTPDAEPDARRADADAADATETGTTLPDASPGGADTAPYDAAPDVTESTDAVDDGAADATDAPAESALPDPAGGIAYPYDDGGAAPTDDGGAGGGG